MATMLLPPKINVPATPALQDVDLNTLYDFTNAKLLGTGGFSQVMAVRHRPTGQMRALKIMQRASLRGKKKEMVAHEKEILRRACHPNVVTLYETIQNSDVICLALDLMDEDLFELIVRHRRVNEDVARMIMFQVLSAINYLHEQSIVHRDIKPENILINVRMRDESCNTNTNNDGGGDGQAGGAAEANKGTYINVNAVDPAKLQLTVKIADFGLAKLVMEWDVRSTPCGTSFYIAPEVIRGIEAQGAKPLCTNQRLVKSVDVWSAGVVLYLLLSGRPPFHGQVKTPEERRALLNKINHGLLFSPDEVWATISDETKDLLLRMLENNSAQRITAAEALRQPFFTRHGFMKPILGGDLSAMMREQAECVRRHQLDLEIQQQVQSGIAQQPGLHGICLNKNDLQVNQPALQQQQQQLQQAVQQQQQNVPLTGGEYGTNNAANATVAPPPLTAYHAQANVQPQPQAQAAANHAKPQGNGEEYYYYSYGTAAVASPNTNQPPGNNNNNNNNNAMAGHFSGTSTNANSANNGANVRRSEGSGRTSNNNNTAAAAATATATAANPNSSGETNSSSNGSGTTTNTTNSTNKRSFFGGFAHLFGSGSKRSSKESNEKAMNEAVSEEEQQKLRDALAELQHEVIQADDAEGEETSYRVNMPIHEARPSRPAMMNSKVKVGPAALKKK